MKRRRLVSVALGSALMATGLGLATVSAAAAPKGSITLLRAATYKDVADVGLGSVLVRALVRYRDPIPAARRGRWFAVTETTLVGPGGRTVARSAEPVPGLFRGQDIEHRVVVDAAQASRLAGDGQDLTRIRVNMRAYVTQSRMASNEVTTASGRAVLQMRATEFLNTISTVELPPPPQTVTGDGVSIVVAPDWQAPQTLAVTAFYFSITDDCMTHRMRLYPQGYALVGLDGFVPTFAAKAGTALGSLTARTPGADATIKLPVLRPGGLFDSTSIGRAWWRWPAGTWTDGDHDVPAGCRSVTSPGGKGDLPIRLKA